MDRAAGSLMMGWMVAAAAAHPRRWADDPGGQRALDAMMQMKKIDIAAIEAAYRG